MKILLTISCVILLVGSAFAIDSYVPYEPGVYLQGYPTYMTASNWYDSDGESADMGGTWSLLRFGFEPTYFGMMGDKRWQASASIPFMSYSPSLGDSKSGLGDLQLSAAYWVIDDHKKGTYLSVWFWADLPTGGDGLSNDQMNLRPGLAWAMEKAPYQFEVSAWYNLRMENSDTNYKPGNEIWANMTFGYHANEQMTPGLEIQTGWGSDDTYSDVTWPDSKTQWFKVGPSLEYNINPKAAFKVEGLYTVMGKNTTQSIDIGARITWAF